MRYLREAMPRTLIAQETRPPVLLFTDGALEGDKRQLGTIGAALYDGSAVEYFGVKLPRWVMEVLQRETENVIAAIELFPIALSMDLWADRFEHRQFFCIY